MAPVAFLTGMRDTAVLSLALHSGAPSPRSRVDDATPALQVPTDEISRLFLEEHRRLYLVALRLLANAAQAEDVVQEAFLRAWKTWTSFRGESSRSTWIHSITVRCALNIVRGDRRARTLSLDDTATSEPAAPRQHHETRIDLERAIATLPTRARMVFVLRDIEGFPVDEVAVMLDIAPGTVKAHLFLARQRLASALEPNGRSDD